MDEIDLAQQYDEYYRQAALRNHYRRRNNPLRRDPDPTPFAGAAGAPGSGNGICHACGAEIEPARLAAVPGAVRCIGCQTRHERRALHA